MKVWLSIDLRNLYLSFMNFTGLELRRTDPGGLLFKPRSDG